ncbi:MAG TPA: FimV/HubP family polar landmark protein [Methylophilaceae bacterium]|nr:FimV/HubP family polar landmark protein [Methylophilaceae bacterium]
MDPIAEAEVYMAYGRDAQAEEILKDAIAKEPKRYELHLKLLEIFAARNDISSFETIAGELYSTLGASDPTWIKVAEIGRKLEPDNPLYTTAAAGALTAAATESELEPKSKSVQREAVNSDKLAHDFADAELVSAAALDFSLNNDNAAGADQSQTASENGGLLELDQKTIPTAYEDAAPEADLAKTVTVMEEPQAQDNSMDFSLDFPEPATVNPETVQLDVADFGHTVSENDLPAFDVPELIAETATEEIHPEADHDVTEISFDLPETTENDQPFPAMQDLPSLDFTGFEEEKASDADAAAMPVEEKIVFESLPEQPDAIHFDFSEDDESAAPTATASINTVPEIDLSAISFDLDGGDDADKAGLSGESAEVNTKIDLVSAYIDMDDIEGAKELLEEVLKEGGPNQRQYAQKLLDSLA